MALGHQHWLFAVLSRWPATVPNARLVTGCLGVRAFGGGLGDARLGASRWFAGAVIHSLGARVALPRAEVPNVSSSEGYPSSCPIAYAQNNAVDARIYERKPAGQQQSTPALVSR